MAFQLPDKGVGDSPLQSIFFHEYIDILVAGISGIDCVLSGGAVTGGANMTPSVAKCGVLSNGVLRAVAANTVAIGTADATNPRFDLIVVDSSGALQVRAGTPASSPKPPARTANDVVLAVVYIPAGDTAIATSQIIDMRVMRENGPICIYRSTTAETTDTTASAIHILNKAGSGLVIPNGLFLTGRKLRVRIGGNVLLNSGTPTITLAVSFGGTTMFQDATGAATADTDRLSFFLDFDISAQSNSDQELAGYLQLSIMGAKITPTTGIGDISATAALGNSFQGESAVNADAANRTLATTFTLSVSNAANQVIVETCTVELI